MGRFLDSTILAALEDAVLLGADSVNMSLGASAGFGDTRETAVQDAYYRCAQAGVSLMIAAGNDRNSAVGNRYGNSLPLAESPDSALVSTPSTSFAAMSVASVENFKVTCGYMKLGQTEILFQNGVDNGSGQELRAAEMICGGEKEVTLPYVMVPGLGAPEDYEGLDVAGKIAVVQRGVLGFSEKANYAAAAGAVGCILYNNQAGGLVPGLAESVSIGTVGISLEDGQKLEQAEEKLISFSPDWVDYRAMDTCAKPSDFSDWGTHAGPTVETGNGCTWWQHFLCQAWRRLSARERHFHGMSPHGRCSGGGAAVFGGRAGDDGLQPDSRSHRCTSHEHGPTCSAGRRQSVFSPAAGRWRPQPEGCRYDESISLGRWL